MLTEKYFALSIQEQREYIGALLHACQTNESCYEAGLRIIRWASNNGVLSGVKILPEGWDNVPPENQFDNQ